MIQFITAIIRKAVRIILVCWVREENIWGRNFVFTVQQWVSSTEGLFEIKVLSLDQISVIRIVDVGVLLLLLLLEELLLQLLMLMLVMAVVVGRSAVDHSASSMRRVNGIGGVHAVRVLQLFEVFPCIPDVDQSGFRGDRRIRHNHHDIRVAGERVDEGRKYAIPNFHRGKLSP